MMQPLATKNLKKNSLRRSGGARTVLLRMAADQERADRIRALKESRPDLTWRRIGDHVGVSERSAFEWGKKGGIEYENAKRLAELFDVDADYIWRGAGITAPDLFGADGDDDQDVAAQLSEIRTLLVENNRLLKALAVGPVPLPSGTLGRVLRGEETTPPTETPAQRQQARDARLSTG